MLFDWMKLSASYSRFTQEELSVTGNERRDILDACFSGAASGFHWDLEAMGQRGEIANQSIRAWAVGSLAGYTFTGGAWTPRLGLQLDAASGDSDPHGSVLRTFNPLFPNGYYFTLAGYTTYVNMVHPCRQKS